MQSAPRWSSSSPRGRPPTRIEKARDMVGPVSSQGLRGFLKRRLNS
jgi:hypothetical protein